MCRWPIGDPAATEFHFCGRCPKSGSPYCEAHARKAYQPQQAAPDDKDDQGPASSRADSFARACAGANVVARIDAGHDHLQIYRRHRWPAKTLALANWRGRVLLIVNTASECGFTPQYAGLEALYEKLEPQGLTVLGFPCNQFGAQEPGSEAEIGAFCQKNYGVTFPMFAKIDVNGAGRPPAVPVSQASTSPAFWAPKRSNGISPNSWSTATASRWRAMRPRPSRKSWKRRSGSCFSASQEERGLPLPPFQSGQ